MSVEVTDKKGRVWQADPAKHLFGDDGQPRVNPHTGIPMPRSSGRKSAAGENTPPAASAPAPAASAAPSTTAETGGVGSSPAPAAPPTAAVHDAAPAPSFDDIKPLLADTPEPAAEAKAAPTPPAGSSAEEHEVTAGTVTDGLELIADVVFDDNVNVPANEKQKIARAYGKLAAARGWNYGPVLGLCILGVGFMLRIFRNPKPKAALRAWLGLAAVHAPKNVTPPAPPAKPAPTSAAPATPSAYDLPPTNRLG